jgi:hypothetical protein
MTDYFDYWAPHLIGDALDRWTGPVTSADRGWYSKLERGDVVWVFGRAKNDRPVLVARLSVSRRPHITSTNSAYRVIVPRSEAKPLKAILFTWQEARRLRFTGKLAKIRREGAEVYVKDLSAMLTLTPESAAILRQRWREKRHDKRLPREVLLLTAQPAERGSQEREVPRRPSAQKGRKVPEPARRGTLFPEELPNGKTYLEGRSKQILVNAYERASGARKACIKKYGAKCAVCDLSFAERYGPLGRDFIHVHHKRPLSSLGKQYELNAVQDLVPVCPNCHAMLHRGKKVLTIQQLKALLR